MEKQKIAERFEEAETHREHFLSEGIPDRRYPASSWRAAFRAAGEIFLDRQRKK